MGVFKTTTNNAFVTSHGHEIRFTNKWRLLPLVSIATLQVDGVVLAENRDVMHVNPNIPLMSEKNVSEKISSIDVYVIGATSIKIAISVNGEFVYQDEIGFLEKLHSKLSPK